MRTIELPLREVLEGEFLGELAGGGAAVRSEDGRAVLLLDREFRTVATAPLPALDGPVIIQVSEPAGLVSVAHDTGLVVTDLAGAEVFRREHAAVEPNNDAVFSGDGTWLWTVTPDHTVEVLDTNTWRTLAGARLAYDPDWQLAWLDLFADPAEKMVTAQVVRTNGDGTYGGRLRFTVDGLAGEPLPDGYVVHDVRPTGGELTLLDEGQTLALFDVAAGTVAGRLDWADISDPEPAAGGSEVYAGHWYDADGIRYLGADRLVTQTSEGQLLLFDREPLRLVAALRPEGFGADEFTGWHRWPSPAPADPQLAFFRSWGADRIVVDGRNVYDVPAELAEPAPPV